MPKILERLVSQLEAKGKPKSNAYAIATSQLQKAGDLKPGTQKPTAKGVKRGNMSAKERAVDRQAKYENKPKSAFSYSSKTNRATQRKR